MIPMIPDATVRTSVDMPVKSAEVINGVQVNKYIITTPFQDEKKGQENN